MTGGLTGSDAKAATCVCLAGPGPLLLLELLLSLTEPLFSVALHSYFLGLQVQPGKQGY